MRLSDRGLIDDFLVNIELVTATLSLPLLGLRGAAHVLVGLVPLQAVFTLSERGSCRVIVEILCIDF